MLCLKFNFFLTCKILGNVFNKFSLLSFLNVVSFVVYINLGFFWDLGCVIGSVKRFSYFSVGVLYPSFWFTIIQKKFLPLCEILLFFIKYYLLCKNFIHKSSTFLWPWVASKTIGIPFPALPVLSMLQAECFPPARISPARNFLSLEFFARDLIVCFFLLR